MAEAATQLKVMRNPAEEGFLKLYAKAKDSLPGTAHVAKARQDAMAKFEELGLPHRRVEEWKYTDLRAAITEALPLAEPTEASWDEIASRLGALADLDAAVLVMLNGHYSEALSNPGAAGDGATILPLSKALADDCFAEMHGSISNIPAEDMSVALNTGLMQDGVAVHISSTPAKPLHIIHVTDAREPAQSVTRHVISVEKNVTATVVESFVSLGDVAAHLNTVTHLGLDEESQVRHIKVQQENRATVHLASWAVELAAKAEYEALQVTTGAALTRNQVYLTFRGPDASASVNGAYMQRGTQHCDSTLIIDHIEPGCTSRELFKGVLDDQARGVFQGKIMVKPEAQKTDGKQMSQALLLSEESEFDSKPELEIFADDVVCGHGSTSGAIDEDLLFYLRARGIPEEKARALLVQAFVAEAFEIVEDDEALYGALIGIVEAWMTESG